MADTIIDTNTSTDVTITAGDDYVLLPGVTHYSTTSTTVSLDAPTALRSNFHIYGSLISTAFNGLQVTDPVALPGLVLVGESGSVAGTSNFRGIFVGVAGTVVSNLGEVSGSVGIDMNGNADDVRLYNAGTVLQSVGSSSISAVRSFALNLQVVNDGLIMGRNGIRAEDAMVVNAGRIVADIAAIESTGAATDTLTVVNSGLIQGGEAALRSDLSPVTLKNTGEILGDVTVLQEPAMILNTGTLQGAVTLSDAVDTVSNGGVIAGDVELDDGDDRYGGTGDGQVTGIVNGGSGNDTLSGSAQADNLQGDVDDDMLMGRGGNDTLFGGDGLDTLTGGDGQDLIRGNADVDLLRGGAGNDTMFGDGGVDQLFGETGADEMEGGAEDDRMFGGDGNDFIKGGAGSDRMLGDGGDDRLRGDAGRDNINGGLGADTFIYQSATDSPFATPDGDRILDFEPDIDRLDLSGLIGPALEFYGTGAFGGAPGVRLVESGTSVTQVLVDLDGDTSADMRVWITNTHGLDVDDFIL